jgi:hypothetical protein
MRREYRGLEIVIPVCMWYGDVSREEARALAIVYRDVLRQWFPGARVRYEETPFARMEGELPYDENECGMVLDEAFLEAVERFVRDYDTVMARVENDLWLKR